MQEFQNFNGLVLLLTFALNIGLSVYVFIRDRENQSNRSLAAFLFFVAVWVLSFLVYQSVSQVGWVLAARRFTPVGSSLLAGYFLFFTLVFPEAKAKIAAWLKAAVLLPGVAFSALSLFSGYMIKNVVVLDPGRPYLGEVVYGPAYYLFAVYFVTYYGWGIYNLASKYFKAQGKEKLQLFYSLFGFLVAGLGGIGFSLILPLYGLSNYFFLSGPLFTLILAGFLCYAIARHKLLDITDFFPRGLWLLVAAILISGTAGLVFSQSFEYILPFYLVMTIVCLGTLVLSQSFFNPINWSFFGTTIFIAIWAFSIFRFWASATTQQAFFWAIMANSWSAFIPAFFLKFSRTFPRGEKGAQPLIELLWFLPAVLFLLAAYGRFVVADVVLSHGLFSVVPGPLFALFSIYIVGYFILAFASLIRKYFRYSGTTRVQIRYVFLGFFLSSMVVFITNLILPLYGISVFTQYGPYFTVVFLGFTSYAIVRHRLMSIEIVLQRSTVYTLATILTMALYALAVIVSEFYLRSMIGYSSVLVTAFAALVIALMYQPLLKSLQNLTDRLFFRGRYDYQRTLSEVSQKIASVIKLEELTKLISSSFVDTMKVAEISFLLREKEGEHFHSISLPIARYKKIEIDKDSPIVAQLTQTKDILARDEVEDTLIKFDPASEISRQKKSGLEQVRDAMDRLGIPVWVPIVSKNELIGIIALGNKLSGDIFTSEDLALLTTLSNQTAVALDNARLYDEVLTMKNYSEDILQSMTNGVLTTDVRGRLVTYNYMAERITGRRFDDVIGKSCEELWGRRGTITLVFENSFKDRAYLNYETGIASPERGMVPVAISSTLLRDSQGKKMGVLISIQDLTEMKEMEDKIRRADKLTALATMASGMAHEIKNPLSSMKVFSQLLPQKYGDPEFRKKLEEILPREIDRIDRIVESLLGFARSTAPTFAAVRLEDVLEEDLKYFDNQAKNSGVTIKKSYAALPEIEVDKAQVSQAFSNLILNAIQAMAEGGELTVETLPGKKVEDILQTVKVRISDTGHGIHAEMIKKLFDPFFTTKYGGTGLGLTITHSIIDGHKGFIDVESKVGKGTTFTVTLPTHQS